MRVSALLILLAFPALAGPLDARPIAFGCSTVEGKRVCQLSEEDWKYMMTRDQALSRAVEQLSDQLGACHGRRRI